VHNAHRLTYRGRHGKPAADATDLGLILDDEPDRRVERVFGRDTQLVGCTGHEAQR
jgi:hypothetical protein